MLDLNSELAKEVYTQFCIMQKMGMRRYMACLYVLARQFDLRPDIIDIIIQHYEANENIKRDHNESV